MQYDGEKYYYGTKFINNADDLLTDIYRATDDIKGYHGFEYKNTLNEIKMTIFEVMSDCTAISNTIEMGRQNIASMNSDFDVQYLEASHYDFSNMSVTEQEENRYLIKYTDEEIARELKKHQNNAANVDISDEALRVSMILNDQNFSNLSVEEQQDQIDNFRDEVIKYQKMSWYEKALKNTGAFVCGTVNGLANVAESVVDGAATLESACILYATPVGPLMHVVSHFQEQSGVAKEDTVVGKYKEKVKGFVDKNWADDIYDGIVEKYGMNKYIWKGKYYSTGKTVGTMAGYTGLSFIPGGPVVTGVVTGLAAAGDAAETAYNNGASYDQGVVAAGVAGGVGFLSGAALDKIRGASKLVTTKAGVLGYALLGSGTAMSEPVVNAVAQYNLYAKNQIDENGNKVYNNFGDYFKKSGGLQSTFMAAGIGGASILPSAVKNYKTNLIETKLSQEMLDNVYRLDFDNPSQYNEYLDSLTPEQRTKFMSNYYNNGSAFSTLDYDDYIYHNKRQTEYNDLFNSPEAEAYYKRGQIQKEYNDLFGGDEYVEYAKRNWKKYPGVNDNIANIAEVNYNKNSHNFSSKAAYYEDLMYTESKNYWTENELGDSIHHVIEDPDDLGVNKSLTQQAVKEWNNAVDAATNSSGKTRLNIGYTDTEVFDRFILTKNELEYGQLGMPDNYNFARIGDAKASSFNSSSTDMITQYKADSGIPNKGQKHDRILFLSHDVPRESISMHSGKEFNSYSERLPGCCLPNGDYELVYKTQSITNEIAESSFVEIFDSKGNPIWNGSLEDLKAIKNDELNLEVFDYIMYG